jgi:hypothetical protein
VVGVYLILECQFLAVLVGNVDLGRLDHAAFADAGQLEFNHVATLVDRSFGTCMCPLQLYPIRCMNSNDKSRCTCIRRGQIVRPPDESLACSVGKGLRLQCRRDRVRNSRTSGNSRRLEEGSSRINCLPLFFKGISSEAIETISMYMTITAAFAPAAANAKAL